MLVPLLDEIGLPWWLSYSCDGLVTRAGQPLAGAFAVVASSPSVVAVGVNCCAPDDVLPALRPRRLGLGQAGRGLPQLRPGLGQRHPHVERGHLLRRRPGPCVGRGGCVVRRGLLPGRALRHRRAGRRCSRDEFRGRRGSVSCEPDERTPMLADSPAFSGFSTNDPAGARAVLRRRARPARSRTARDGFFTLKLAGGQGRAGLPHRHAHARLLHRAQLPGPRHRGRGRRADRARGDLPALRRARWAPTRRASSARAAR